MRILALLLPLLLIGCISVGPHMNDTNLSNETGQNITVNETQNQNGTQNLSNETQSLPLPKVYERYDAGVFSFEFPLNMDVQVSKGSYGGIFTGTHGLDGQTGELIVITYMNTSAAFGANKDEIFKGNPTKAASDFLIEDQKDDPAGSLLSDAYDVGELTTFTVAKVGYVAQVPFRIRFSDPNRTYSGYALSIYVPERSLHVKFRIISLNPETAVELKDNFLLSFRAE